MPLGSEAQTLWTWAKGRFDDPTKASWCPAGKKTGPSYATRVTEQALNEIADQQTNGYGLDKGESYMVGGVEYGDYALEAEYKKDGNRSVQGALQLWQCVNAKWTMKARVGSTLVA